jgi:acetyl esterase/lipase
MHREVTQEVDATHRIALFRHRRPYPVCAKETKIFAEFTPCDKNPRTIHKSELERPDNALGRPPFTVNIGEFET